jgi:hypothetical protein
MQLRRGGRTRRGLRRLRPHADAVETALKALRPHVMGRIRRHRRRRAGTGTGASAAHGGGGARIGCGPRDRGRRQPAQRGTQGPSARRCIRACGRPEAADRATEVATGPRRSCAAWMRSCRRGAPDLAARGMRPGRSWAGPSFPLRRGAGERVGRRAGGRNEPVDERGGGGATGGPRPRSGGRGLSIDTRTLRPGDLFVALRRRAGRARFVPRR